MGRAGLPATTRSRSANPEPDDPIESTQGVVRMGLLARSRIGRIAAVPQYPISKV